MLETLAEKLLEKGIFGFITLDLVAFPDPNNPKSHPLFWVNGIKCHYNNFNAISAIASSAARQREDVDRGLVGELGQVPRIVTSVPFLVNSSMPSINLRSFFHLARLDSMFFDIASRKGIIFMISDTLQSGVMGIVSIADDQIKTYEKMIKCLDFLRKQSAPNAKNERYGTAFIKPRGDQTDFNDVYGGFKIVLKTLRTLSR